MPKAPVDLCKIQSLVEDIAALRGIDGCPWDKEQTHTTLTQYAIEEVFELVEAIESAESQTKDAKIKDELGDVLFQVLLHSQLAAERGAFTFDDIIENLGKKLAHRHPHVFKVTVTDTSINTNTQDNILNVPPGLPALQRAYTIGKRTEKLKFDWENAKDVWHKVEEEHLELKEALNEKSRYEIEHELGDVFFSLAQLSRHLDFEPEQVLRKANRRFESRFAKMKEFALADHKNFDQLSTEEKEIYWQKAKKALKEKI